MMPAFEANAKMSDRQVRVARIIFERVAAQIAGVPISDAAWSSALALWQDNPALVPIVEASIDAAAQILKELDE